MKNRGAYLGLLGPALWAGVVLLTLGTVYPAKAADDPVKAEAARLAAELRQAQDQVAVLQSENKKLRAELKDEQLKNAIDVDQEVKRLRDLLRPSPEKEALAQALAQAKADVAALERKLAAQTEALQAEAERERARAEEERARSDKRAQAEIERLSDELTKKTAQTRLYEERITQLIEQVAAIKRELGTPKGPKPEDPPAPPKVEPKPDDGPTPEQLKRLQDALRRREEETRRGDDKPREKEPKNPKDEQTIEQLRRLAEEVQRREAQAREEAELARQKAEQARREAEARAAIGEQKPDSGRLDAEVRAARLEVQLEVMKMAYEDLRKETNRLRQELDTERKARVDHGAAADAKTQQRIEQLEAQVAKLSTVVEVLLKKIDMVRPER
jgi:DNA repair exonuclease SbcCD ATPase subunit